MRRRQTISQSKLADYVSWSGFAVGCASLVPVFTQNQTSFAFYIIICIGALIILLGLCIRISDFAYGIMASMFDAGLTRIGRCLDHHIDEVHEMAKRYFGDDITDVNKIKEIQRKFRDGLQVAIKKDANGRDIVAGYFFLFPINKRCVDKIFSFEFEVSKIDQADIATRPQYGHAMYIGAIAADGIFARRELLGAIKLADSLVARTKTKTVYARAATKRGLELLVKNGFTAVHPKASGIDCFFMKIVQ